MSDVAALESQRQLRTDQAEFAALIQRLMNNSDFKKVILDRFCKDEVIRNMNLAGHPGMEADARADCLNAAYAGGHLMRFLIAQEQMGMTANDEIRQLDIELEEARQEEQE